MNIGTKLITSLLLLSTSSAIALESAPVLIGFAEIPAIHEPMWFELIEHGGSRQIGDTSQVTLYATPNDEHSGVLVINDFSLLYASHTSHDDSLKAHVYGKVPGWYQIKTKDERLLWILEIQTSNFIGYLDALGDLVFSSSPGLILSVHPSDDSEIVEPHDDFFEFYSYLIIERKFVNGELWLRLKYEWYSLIHEGMHEDDGVSREDDRFDYRGWVRAYDLNGESNFSMLGPMC